MCQNAGLTIGDMLNAKSAKQIYCLVIMTSDKGRLRFMTNDELLKHWQKRLGLSDWRIKLVCDRKPDEMTLGGVSGCTEWSESIKTARIEILDPLYYGERIVPFDFEKTLVHELLHLKMSFWCQNEDSVEDRVMHQIIDDLARAFTYKEEQNE